MSDAGVSWVDAPAGRGGRQRRVDAPVPDSLSLDLLQHREILVRWVRAERQSATRARLLTEAADAGIERVEAACERLLRDGWIERREKLEGGTWQWHAVVWRDLERVQRLLGVAGRRQRDVERQQTLDDARSWLRARSAGAAPADPDLLDELAGALEQLAGERALPLDTLRLRLGLLRVLADWNDEGAQGLRRDFALRAAGTTKAIGVADWRWLEASFDLQRLRIDQFSPMLWLAGDATLQWGERRVDLAGLHCVGLALDDVLRVERLLQPPTRYWLIENRTSFERKARSVQPGVVLLWLPGRPSSGWTQAVAHLLDGSPAPAWISADADPAGVEIACHAGDLWRGTGLEWEPHLMGVPQWQATRQHWPLNDHDRALLGRLLARTDLPESLRALCLAMQREARKAEQEGWL